MVFPKEGLSFRLNDPGRPSTRVQKLFALARSCNADAKKHVLPWFGRTSGRPSKPEAKRLGDAILSTSLPSAPLPPNRHLWRFRVLKLAVNAKTNSTTAPVVASGGLPRNLEAQCVASSVHSHFGRQLPQAQKSES